MDEIYWIEHDKPPRLAIVARPRGDEWLERDLSRLKNGGIDVVVSMLEPQEAVYLGLRDEADAAAHVGLEFISYPIQDCTTPDDKDSFRCLVARLVDSAHTGRRIGAHCRGCIGRSTVVMAAVLIQLGIKPAEAVALIREARGCVVPDTPEQLKWILAFQPEP